MEELSNNDKKKSFKESETSSTSSYEESFSVDEAPFPYEEFKEEDKDKARKLKMNKIVSDVESFGYHMSYRKGFYYLIRDEHKIPDINKKGILKRVSQEQETGWKFHISVDNKSLTKAWDILQKIMIKYGINYIKIIDPKLIKNSQNQMTIYIFKNPKVSIERWAEILNKIEDTFDENKIKPSKEYPELLVDRHITGSKYISYRHDGIFKPNGKMKYLNEEETKIYAEENKVPLHNPSNLDDPYEDLKIENREDREYREDKKSHNCKIM